MLLFGLFGQWLCCPWQLVYNLARSLAHHQSESVGIVNFLAKKALRRCFLSLKDNRYFRPGQRPKLSNVFRGDHKSGNYEFDLS